MSPRPRDPMRPERLEQLLDNPFGGKFFYIREYTGPRPKHDWNRNPIVGPPDRPFAALQLVQRLERDGSVAGWSYRPGEFISTWEPEKRPVHFPSDANILLDRISDHAGSRARCWDVFAWKDWKPLFIDLKRRGSSERLNNAQKRWKDAALDIGVMPSAFREREWIGGSLDGYLIKGMSTMQGRTLSWVKYRRGRYEFGGQDPQEAKDWLEEYGQWTGLKGADLVWVLFRDNAGGAVTYWNLEQSRDREEGTEG